MGYELISSKKYLPLNNMDFESLLDVAKDFGWHPKGTLISDGMAEELAEQFNLLAKFTTIFYFAGTSETSCHCIYSDHKLTKEEIQNIAKNAEQYFFIDRSEFGDCNYEVPLRLVRVVVEVPTRYTTKSPEQIKAEWCGEYLSNDGQTIETDDCLNISDALMRASKYVDDDLAEAIDLFRHGPVRIC